MVNTDGTFSYTPNANFNGADSFTYTLTDANGDVSTATVSVTVTAVNDLPVAVDDSLTVAEDSGQPPAPWRATTPRPATAATSGRWARRRANGTAVVNSDGTYSYTPNANFNGTDSFTYTLTDANGDVSTATVSVTVTAVNDLPVAVDDSLTVAEDSGTSSGTLAGNDTPSGDGGNVWALGTAAANGTAVVNSDGSYSYTPNANFNGADSFTYTLTDANGDVSTATVSVTVTAVNDLPVAVDDSLTVAEDSGTSSGTLAGNDTPSGDGGNVWALGTAAANGTAVVNSDGSYSYTPNANFNGTDSFTYTLTDANGDISTATVSVTVTAVNDLPVAVDDSLTVAEDSGTSSGTLAGNDTPSGDGGNVWALGTAAANGTAVVNRDGSYSYTPNANFNGTDSFTYTLTDANGDVSTATVSVTVTAVNDLPVAVDDSLTVAEDSGTSSGTLAGNDTPSGDGGNVWALGTAAANGTAVVNSDGSYSYTPNANYNGADSFTYTLTDANGDVSTATVSITVTAVNDLPVAVADSVTVNEDTVFSGTLAGNDTPSGDGGNVWALGAPASNGSAAVNSDGSFSYTPNANYNGADSFTYTLTDANGDVSTATVSVTVTAVNDLPVAVADSVTVNEDTVFSGTLAGNDTPSGDGGNVWALGAPASHGSAVVNPDGSFSYTPNANYNGADSFTYTLTDANGDVSTATVSVTVTAVNDLPVAVDDSLTVAEDSGTTAGTLAGNDTPSGDGGNVWALATPASHGSAVVNADGSFSYTPNANFNGTDSFTYTLTDANGDSSTAAVTVTVNPVDDPLTIDGLNDGTVVGTDGSVRESDLATGTTPTGSGEAHSGSFSINAPDGIASLQIGSTTLSLAQLLASDVTPQTLVSARGTLVINGYNAGTGVVSYRYTLTSPASSGAPINDTFALTLTDVQGGNTSTANLAIAIIDDAPIARNESDEAINLSNNPSSLATGNVLTGVDAGLATDDPNTTDGIADKLGADGPGTPVITGVASGLVPLPGAGLVNGVFGTLILAADGQYTYVPNYADPAISGLPPNGSQVDTFTYEITDGDGDKSTATLTITIVGTPAIIGLGDGAVAGTDGSVLESNLISGTNPVGLGDLLNGSFLAITPKGLQSLNVGGTSIPEADLLASGTTPIVITTANGTLIINGYNATIGVVNYTYTLITPANSLTKQSDDFGVFVVDDLGNSTASVTKVLKIAIIDDVPIANNESDSVTEDSGLAATGNVVTGIDAGGDSNATDGVADNIGADANAAPVTAVMAGIAGTPLGGIGSGIAGLYGTLTLNANGSYSYLVDNANPTVNALPAGGSLNDVFTYQLTDADGSQTTATLTIAIAGVNDAPVADNESVTTPEDSPIVIDVLNGDIDVDGSLDPASVYIGGTAGPGLPLVVAGQGTWSVNTGTGAITFTPELNYNGTPTPITYTVKDNLGLVSNAATVSVIVTAVNDLPVAADDSLTVAEDSGATGGTLAGNDTPSGDGGNVWALATPASHGSAVVNSDGSYSYTPNANFNGSDRFTYTLTDADGDVSTATVSVTVTAVNDLPVAVDDSLTVAEDSGASSGTLAGNDTPSGDGGNVWALGTPASHGSAVVNSDGTFSYTPDANYNGPDSFTYTLTDANGDVSTAIVSVSVTVTAVNDLPVAADDSLTVAEDSGTSSGTLAGNDTPSGDGGNLWALATAAAHGSAVVNPDGTFTYTPNANYNGPDSFTYTLTDANGDVSTATVSVTVTAVNDLPVARADSVTVNEDTVFSGTLAGNDTPSGDGGNVWALATPASHGSAVVNPDGSFSYTPNANYNGPDSFTYTLTDANGDVSTATVSVTVTVTVTAVNDLPVAVDDSALFVTGDSNPKIHVLANDSDAEDGKPTLIDLDPGSPGIQSTYTNADGTFTATGGVVAFTPFNPAFTGSTSVNYVAIDSAGAVSNVAVATFIFSGEVTDNGSLIMITNPAPPLFPPYPGGETYPLIKYSDSRPFLHDGDLYQSVHFDYRGETLYLVGSLRNHLVLELRSYSFDIPRWAFRHSNPTERLEFEATKPDGSPLPKWLRFDPNRLRFTGIPPLGAKTTQVMVTARDSAGNEVQAYFTVIVNKEPEHPNQRHFSVDVEQPLAAQSPVAKDHGHTPLDKVAGGKAGLTEQIQAAGKLGRLQESRALLDSLKHL